MEDGDLFRARRHDLKCFSQEFRDTLNGARKHECRRNDRRYSVGDEILLWEWKTNGIGYTGNSLLTEVTFVTTGPRWDIPPGCVVMSIRTKKWRMP